MRTGARSYSASPPESAHLHGVVRVDWTPALIVQVEPISSPPVPSSTREGADPGSLADPDVAVHVARVVDARAFAEAEPPGPLPPVEEQLVEGEVAVPALAELLGESVTKRAQLLLGHARASRAAATCSGGSSESPSRKHLHHHSKLSSDQISSRWFTRPDVCSSSIALDVRGLEILVDARAAGRAATG